VIPSNSRVFCVSRHVLLFCCSAVLPFCCSALLLCCFGALRVLRAQITIAVLKIMGDALTDLRRPDQPPGFRRGGAF
jgi:hypothetical protein